MALYHCSIGFPRVYFPQGVFNLRYSEHALSAAYHDKYRRDVGAIKLPSEILVKDDRLIECEIVNKRIVKLVYRIPYCAGFDLCLAIALEKGKPWTVKTVWLNCSNDHHYTLRAGMYTKP